MKHISFVIILICIFIQSGLSQGDENAGVRILFHGLVMDESTFSPIVNTQIMVNRAFSSVSGNDGTFAFYVNRNDTIVFKRLGYKPTIMCVSDTLTGRDFIAGVFLSSDTLEIGEVVIVPRLAIMKSEIFNASNKTPATFENAKYNVAVSAYQGRTSQNKLGDPVTNYEFLRQQQKVDAFERGGIPSDRIVGISPLLLIPGAYLLLHDLPERPAPFIPQITDSEIDQIHKKYLKKLKQRK
jgi:hypothetical protein